MDFSPSVEQIAWFVEQSSPEWPMLGRVATPEVESLHSLFALLDPLDN